MWLRPLVRPTELLAPQHKRLRQTQRRPQSDASAQIRVSRALQSQRALELVSEFQINDDNEDNEDDEDELLPNRSLVYCYSTTSTLATHTRCLLPTRPYHQFFLTVLLLPTKPSIVCGTPLLKQCCRLLMTVTASAAVWWRNEKETTCTRCSTRSSQQWPPPQRAFEWLSGASLLAASAVSYRSFVVDMAMAD